MTDARFADADPAPLALLAGDAEDLTVISTLVQDAVLQVSDVSYDSRHRQLALLLNRFRWEDAEQARREDRPYERVRAVLLISDVQKVQSDGIDRRDATFAQIERRELARRRIAAQHDLVARRRQARDLQFQIVLV